MSAATVPFTSAQPKDTPWTPTDRDRLIFQWVKFEGQTQSWVADQLEISQSTVSRTIERYERWIARGGPAQQGALTHDERLRTQRWLTYERNEWLLASAMRIAGEMERVLDTSKSTISRPVSNPSKETEVRTEHRTIDRSGIAARFIRLAYRINMDQLKLAEREPLPALEPLTIEDLGENAGGHGHPARADRVDEGGPTIEFSNVPSEPDVNDEHVLHLDRPSPDVCDPPTSDLRLLPSGPAATSSIELSPDSPPMHTTHNPACHKSTATTSHKTTSAQSASPENSPAPAYAAVSHSPETGTDICQSTSASPSPPPTTHHSPTDC